MPFEEDDEAWPDEPSEFDPDSLGPSVDTPSTGAPELDDDVDEELFRTFWATVVMANVGLFAASLGLMFAVFREQYRLGGLVFGIGALALLFGYRHYRTYRSDSGDGDDGDDEREGSET